MSHGKNSVYFRLEQLLRGESCTTLTGDVVLTLNDANDYADELDRIPPDAGTPYRAFLRSRFGITGMNANVIIAWRKLRQKQAT